jgi:hypothetical protein
MATDLYTALMSVPGADKAVDFVQQQAANFQYVPQRLERIRQLAETVRTSAAAKNDAVTVGKAAALLSGLGAVQRDYAATSSQLADVVNALRSTAPALNVLAFVPKVIATAGRVALVFKATDAFEKGADGLAAGTLTAQQVAALKRGGPVGGAPAAGTVLLVVGGIAVVYLATRRRR